MNMLELHHQFNMIVYIWFDDNDEKSVEVQPLVMQYKHTNIYDTHWLGNTRKVDEMTVVTSGN